MRFLRSFRWRRFVVLGGLLLLAATPLALRTRFAWDQACRAARARLPELLDADVEIGACELEPLSGGARLKEIRVRPRNAGPGAPPLLEADEASVSVTAVRPGLRTVELGQVRLLRPRLVLDLSRPRPPRDGAPGCGLEPLKRVEVETLEVRDASVDVQLPGGRRVQLEGLQLLAEQRHGAADFEAQVRGGALVPGPGAPALPVSRLLLRGTFAPRDERVEFQRAELGVDAALLSWTGAVETLCTPELALEAQVSLPASALARVAPLPSPVTGHAWARVSVSGPVEAPRAVVDVTGSDVKLGPFEPGDFRAHGRWSDGRFDVEPLEVKLDGGGRVVVRGALEAKDGWPFSGTAEVERAGFGRLLQRSGLAGSWVDFSAGAKLEFTGTGQPFSLGGRGTLEAERFLLAARAWTASPSSGKDILAFPRGEGSFDFEVGPGRAELEHIVVRAGQGQVRADATLSWGARGGLSVRGTADGLDFDELGKLAGIHWAGQGGGDFEVSGPWGGITAEARLRLRDFDFWKLSLGNVDGRLTWGGQVLGLHDVSGTKGRSGYTGRGELHWLPHGRLEANGQLALQKGRAEDVAEFVAPLSETLASLLVGSLAGGASVTVDVQGPGDRLGGSVVLSLEDATYDGRGLGSGDLRFTLFDGEGYRLEPSVLEGPLGTTRAEGQSLYDGPLDYRFQLQGYSLPELLGQREGESKLQGRLDVTGKWQGDSTTPVMSAWITSPVLVVGGRALGDVHLEARMQGRELQLWGRPFSDARASLKLRARAPYPYELQAAVTLGSLGALFPEAAAQGLSGALSATLKAKGAIRQERSTEGELVVDRLQLQRADFSGENEGPLRFSISGGRLGVEAFSFRGPNTHLVLAGTADAEALDLKLGGTFDMRLAESFTSAFDRTGGKVEVTAAATGSWGDPRLAGTAEVKDVRLSLRDHGVALRGLGGRVEFSGARLLVQELSGVLNNGRVRARGEAALDHGRLGQLEATLSFEEVAYRPREWLPLTASGELQLSGKPGALLLQGGVELEKLRYEQALDLQSMLGDLRKGTGVAGVRSVTEKQEEWLRLDVGVKTGREVWVDNNLAKARLVGELRLTGTNVHPGLLGTIETAEGGEAFYRGNRFSITQGQLEFRERDRVEPVFDLNAETQAREFLVRLHAFGRASSPEVVLQAEPELSEADILSLLTLGVVSRDRTGVGGEAGAGLAAEAFLSASGLGDRVQRFLPRNQVFRDLSFHLSTTYNDASGLVEPTAQLESRFLTEQLKLGMTRPMSGRGTRAQAEYRFDARTSAQVQWDNQVSADFNNVGNLGLELKLRWEVD